MYACSFTFNWFCRYVDRIANSKWEVKELGVEHNGFVTSFALFKYVPASSVKSCNYLDVHSFLKVFLRMLQNYNWQAAIFNC